MELQEIYDRVRKHLLTQNKKSHVKYTCQYRGPDRTSCAVGCLIPDELYDPVIEGVSIRTILGYSNLSANREGAARLKSVLERLGLWDEQKGLLLRRLQRIHDSCEPGEWSGELDVLAHEYGLRVSSEASSSPRES